MDTGADIIVFDESGQTILLVQVKAVAPSTREWAAEVRRRTFQRNPPTVPFFLVVARDHTYIWSDGVSDEPAYEAQTDQLFRPYLNDLRATTDDISRNLLELITGSWLIDVSVGLPKATEHPVVRNSGLATHVQHGRIQFAAAA